MSRQTKYLLQALTKWPVVDIKIFLAELIEDGRQDPDKLALSIIDLLVAAARQSAQSYLIFLQAGMLDILLYFYLDGDLSLNTQTAAQKACLDLAKLPVEGCDLELVNRQILPLVASRPTKHYSYINELAIRGQAWRLVHLSLVRRRFQTISVAVREDQWVVWGSEWIVDLVEFMSEHFGNELPFLAFNTFANIIQQREQLVEHVLTEHFKEASNTRDTVFRSAVQLCTSLFQDPIVIPLTVDRHRLRQIVICHFVPLFCAIARTSSACLDALLDARIAEFLWGIALLRDTSYLHFKQDNLNIASKQYETICYDIMDEASQIFLPDNSDALLRYYTRTLYPNRV
ncbi:hypothetical protein EYR40_007524 [Pleurotus pulmonarius]|nr:hypothetical protein EYR38_008177 [Pleurotus pulmonarius]KAF4597074.1 hypothetical protein EYR40_007524 [Pleurotus pulmonarius]